MLGATLFIYEGTPDYPGPDRLWGMVERHRITHLGISPTAGARADDARRRAAGRARPVDAASCSARPGEPWNPDPWRWLFRAVGGGRLPDHQLLRRNRDQRRDPRLHHHRADRPVLLLRAVPGDGGRRRGRRGTTRCAARSGELVIRQPWPGMTQRLLARSASATWRRTGRACPGVWVHGDWARIDEDGYWYISGRSDDTIKVAGKRIGPAEVESAAVAHPLVVEALAVGVPDELKGETIVLFAVVREPGERGEGLASADRRDRGRASRQVLQAGGRARRARPAKDPQRQDPAAPGAGGLPGPRPRRHQLARGRLDA